MIDLYWCLNFSYYFSALLMGAVGLFLIVSTKTPNEKNHHFFIETMLLSMLISFAIAPAPAEVAAPRAVRARPPDVVVFSIIFKNYDIERFRTQSEHVSEAEC